MKKSCYVRSFSVTPNTRRACVGACSRSFGDFVRIMVASLLLYKIAQLFLVMMLGFLLVKLRLVKSADAAVLSAIPTSTADVIIFLKMKGSKIYVCTDGGASLGKEKLGRERACSAQ